MIRLCIFMTLAFSASVSANPLSANPLSTDQQKLSYSFGQQMGKLLNQQDTEYDIDALSLGLTDALTKQPARLSQKDMQGLLMQFQTAQLQKAQTAKQSKAKNNQQIGDAFLANNKTQADVVALPSGLQYQIIKTGTGQSPTATSTVVTHYKGTLIDGTVFDSSYARGKPLEFKLNGVIKGWTEALQLMKPGAKWKIFVPPHLGYGAHGVGNTIGPNATLLFDIELIAVK